MICPAIRRASSSTLFCSILSALRPESLQAATECTRPGSWPLPSLAGSCPLPPHGHPEHAWGGYASTAASTASTHSPRSRTPSPETPGYRLSPPAPEPHPEPITHGYTGITGTPYVVDPVRHAASVG